MSLDSLLGQALAQAPTVAVLLIVLLRLLDLHAKSLDALSGIRSGIEALRDDLRGKDRN